MSWWRRIFGPDNPDTPDENEGAVPTAPYPAAEDLRETSPARLPSLELQRMLNSPSPPHPERLQVLFEEWMHDDDAPAFELLHRLSARFPEALELRLRLAEMLYDRGDREKAVALFQILAQDATRDATGSAEREPANRMIALRCNYLVGDYYADQADLTGALECYSKILAEQFDYPRVRNRVEHIRKRLELPTGLAAPTVLGAEKDGVGDRYLLQRELGRGGSGVVYLAADRDTKRPVAIKLLHPHLAQRANIRARLFHEARLAASLQHPQIITIFELDDHRSMLVTEYCAGGTLADQIGDACLPLPTALDRLCQIARVLAVLHRCGIVHRDIKPSNLLQRGDDGPLVLTDFGIALALEDQGLTEGRGSGSWRYMAPEQRRGSEIDFSADVYSAGIIFLEMVMGSRFPSMGSHPQKALVDRSAPNAWQELGPMLPAPLRDPIVGLCRKLTAADPTARLQDGAELLRDTERLVSLAQQHLRNSALMQEIEDRARVHLDRAEVRNWLTSKRQALNV